MEEALSSQYSQFLLEDSVANIVANIQSNARLLLVLMVELEKGGMLSSRF
jgi:hypothetical protein